MQHSTKIIVSSQARRASGVEAVMNTSFGFLVNFIASYFFLPLFDVPQEVPTISVIVAFYTLLSIGRNYIIRRYFNRLHLKSVGENNE